MQHVRIQSIGRRVGGLGSIIELSIGIIRIEAVIRRI
jgi:hypothetical protein